MVERIGIAFVVVVAVFAIIYAIPRYLTSSGNGEHAETSSDVMGQLDELAEKWLRKPRTWDIGLGILGVVLLLAAMLLYLDPALLGGLEDRMEFVAFSLAILGFSGIFATTYLNIRRSGLYSAEATLIGMALVGTVFLLLVVAALVQ